MWVLNRQNCKKNYVCPTLVEVVKLNQSDWLNGFCFNTEAQIENVAAEIMYIEVIFKELIDREEIQTHRKMSMEK